MERRLWRWMSVLMLGTSIDARATETNACGAFEGLTENLLVWVADGQTHRLTATGLDPQLSYTLEARARLGSLSTTWSQSVSVDEHGAMTATITLPAGAFLHALAEDYVTDLSMKLVGRLDGADQLSLRVPAAFLAWPDGQLAAAVVWDRSTMESMAPLGVVDAALRATFADAEVERVMPPIPFTTTPQEP